MELIDTNVLFYAADTSSEFHEVCRARVERWRRDSAPAYLTWGICYEFMRVSTHPRVRGNPMSPAGAWRFVDALLSSRGIEVLLPTQRHADVLAQTIDELPDIRGSLFHDLRIAVIMREHGIGRICTRDTDFHRFPFLTVIDPLHS